MGYALDDHGASSPDQPSGFTLIELVVTITLLGVVLAGTALLGRHALEEMRTVPRVADRTTHVMELAYLIRRIGEIAVLLSWNDSTITYLDNRGIRRQLELMARGRTTEGDFASLRIDVYPEQSSASSYTVGNSAHGSSGGIPETTQVVIHLVAYRADFDSLALIHTVPFLPFQR